MGDAVEIEFAVKGVVQNGQVVLDTPLAVPDGTVVTVKEFHPSDYPTVLRPPTEEQLQALREDLEFLRARARERDAGHSGGQEAA